MWRIILTSSVLAFACGPKHLDSRPSADADELSGTDAKRSGAQPIEPNRIVTDEVDYDKKDMTDWKVIELVGKPGLLIVELHWDNSSTDLNIAAFDGFGTEIAGSPGSLPGGQVKKLTAQIDKPGTYYLRVTAPKPHDGSVYTMQAQWGEAGAASATPRSELRELSTTKKFAGRFGRDKRAVESGLQGRIVSSYREGTSLVLHIDKGSAAGVEVGQEGAVLEGPSGANPLAGGAFKITQVIDDSRSIGRASLRTVGRHQRVSINTGK